MIVIDASAALELLLGTKRGAAVARRIAARSETLHAPHLLDLEVAQALRRYESSGILDDARSREALTDLADLGIVRYEHDILLSRIWELRHNLTAYDAAYIALGEALGAPVLTADARLAGAPGHRARVERVS